MLGDFFRGPPNGSPLLEEEEDPSPQRSILRRPSLQTPASVEAMPGSRKQKRTTFVDNLPHDLPPRPGYDANTPQASSSLLLLASSPSTLRASSSLQQLLSTNASASPSPSSSLKAQRFRSQMNQLIPPEDYYVRNLPPITICSATNINGSGQIDEVKRLLGPILHLPNDPLLDAQVASLDNAMRGRMHALEAVLKKPLSHTPTKSDIVANKFRRNLETSKSKNPLRIPRFLESTLLGTTAENGSPHRQRPAFFITGAHHGIGEQPHITGSAIHLQRQEQAEARKELARLEQDAELRRHQRNLKALDTLQRKAELYADMILEQEEQKRERERGHTGNQRTTAELIEEWREKANSVEVTDDMIERREKARSIRKVEKTLRHREKVARAIMAGQPIPSFEDISQTRDNRKRWRVTKIGAVDAFSIPRWSSQPVYTFPGDAILEEEESVKINNVLWIRTLQGWVPVHVVLGGFTKTQLFADTISALDGEGITVAMLNAFDDSCEKIDKAYMNCPPEALKNLDEMKDVIHQQEYARATIRELPAGHYDMIKQVWEEMQRKSKHHKRVMEDHAQKEHQRERATKEKTDDHSDDDV